MEITSSILSKPILVKIADALVKTQQEIDDLAVQFSLGKAEAADMFEEIKQTAKERFQDLKNTMILKVGEDRVHKMRERLDDLEVQFALGKSDTLDFYEEQRMKIVQALHNVEVELKTNDNLVKLRSNFITETERLKLKLDVLRKQFETKSVALSHDFKEKVQDARLKIDELLVKAEKKWDDTKETYEDFTDEIKEASKHIRKAIEAL